jgi:rod shape-determining protein MreC
LYDRWDRRYRLVLILLVVISLVLITLSFRAGSTGVSAGLRSATVTLTTPFQRFMTWVSSPFVGSWRFLSGLGTLSKRNADLTKQVADLNLKLARLQELEAENSTLKKLAAIEPPPPGRTAQAGVIGYVPGGWERGLIIDVGRAKGVRPGAPVMVAEGVVGEVVRVGLGGAEVRLITDPRGGTGGLIQQTRDIGVVRGSVTGDLYLRYVPHDSTVKRGDTIVTSGLGGVFPKGLLIGTVKSVADSQAGLYKDIAVRSRVDFRRLERVVVLLDYPKELPKTGPSR